jgi:hypothetical protein
MIGCLKMDIKNNEQREILIYAFRYALGRMTYSVSTMVEVLDRNWEVLKTHEKELIQREIRFAISNECIGMKCDKEQWQKLLDK